MRKFLIIMLSIVCLMTMAACGNQQSAVTETTIEVKRNGSVVHTIVEEFAEEYYSLEDLTQEIHSACEAYNAAAGKERVVTESIELNDGILKVVMCYEDVSDYSSFNQVALFSGTIQKAIDSGYHLQVNLLPADGGEISIGPKELYEMKNAHLLILREAVNVIVWDDVLYYTSNVMETDDPERVMVMEQDALSYIVFK